MSEDLPSTWTRRFAIWSRAFVFARNGRRLFIWEDAAIVNSIVRKPWLHRPARTLYPSRRITIQFEFGNDMKDGEYSKKLKRCGWSLEYVASSIRQRDHHHDHCGDTFFSRKR